MIESYSEECPENICRQVATPSYLIAEDIIENNCRVLQDVQQRTGARILLALKAFALPAVFNIISKYLCGVCASGPIEARLGREEFGREVHTYAPAYSGEQLQRVLEYSDHVLFNSLSQLETHRAAVESYRKKSGRDILLGLRVNPEYSEIATDLYNPCIPGSRFGIKADTLKGANISGITGIHFHALCEQGADVLERIVANFEEKFGWLLADERISWINLGGGHHITRADYDLELLCSLISRLKERYKVEVYLEPGEAVVLNAGFYLTSVLDIIENGIKVAVVDGSAETHLPDVLAMPYHPELLGSCEAAAAENTYRLGGISCLAGDIIGDYGFAQKLEIGERLCFTDMALYSFVKNNTFNGVELPSLYRYSLKRGTLELIRTFDYDDYRRRLTGKDC